MPRALRSDSASTANPKKVMARMRPATMVTDTKNSPTPANAELRRKKASSLHTRFVKGSCRIRRARTLARSACSSLRASDISRPPMRTLTLLSSAGSGVTRPAG